ncbi:hypothetical protein SSCG_01311 [Streptomyces clavuligerus]|nr:hypothetical protein SSCG_01311 [Streptomyces clavuligerus]
MTRAPLTARPPRPSVRMRPPGHARFLLVPISSVLVRLFLAPGSFFSLLFYFFFFIFVFFFFCIFFYL